MGKYAAHRVLKEIFVRFGPALRAFSMHTHKNSVSDLGHFHTDPDPTKIKIRIQIRIRIRDLPGSETLLISNNY